MFEKDLIEDIERLGVKSQRHNKLEGTLLEAIRKRKKKKILQKSEKLKIFHDEDADLGF